MEKDLNLDKSSPTYVPTYKEMGYTLEEFEALDWEKPQTTAEWDARLLAFQIKHRKKIVEKKKQSKEVKMQKFVDHWYSTLNSTEIGLLIEDSRKLADQAIDRVLESEKLPAMRNYYDTLRLKVKTASYKIMPADLNKLARFPSYDKGTNSLTGSAYSFVKLWSHVFSSRKSRGHTMTTAQD